ncbi:tyrosine-type recombinase/integrase [bacterium]|nr:tyrosine-type recombinase/integrase [bacterium]
MRHTFGTHLSRAGVPLRTAQAAMRHSTPTLTANIYTDPRLLDVHGAVESLPTLDLNNPRKDDRGMLKATGTTGEGERKLPPLFPPDSGHGGKSESLPVRSATISDAATGKRDRSKTPEKPRKKAGFPADEETGQSVGMTGRLLNFFQARLATGPSR